MTNRAGTDPTWTRGGIFVDAFATTPGIGYCAYV